MRVCGGMQVIVMFQARVSDVIRSSGRCSRRWLVSISYRYSYHDEEAEHCHMNARWRTASGERFAHVPYVQYAQVHLHVSHCSQTAAYRNSRVPALGSAMLVRTLMMRSPLARVQSAFDGGNASIYSVPSDQAAKGPLRRHELAECLADFVTAAQRSGAFVKGVILDLGTLLEEGCL